MMVICLCVCLFVFMCVCLCLCVGLLSWRRLAREPACGYRTWWWTWATWSEQEMTSSFVAWRALLELRLHTSNSLTAVMTRCEMSVTRMHAWSQEQMLRHLTRCGVKCLYHGLLGCRIVSSKPFRYRKVVSWLKSLANAVTAEGDDWPVHRLLQFNPVQSASATDNSPQNSLPASEKLVLCGRTMTVTDGRTLFWLEMARWLQRRRSWRLAQCYRCNDWTGMQHVAEPVDMETPAWLGDGYIALAFIIRHHVVRVFHCTATDGWEFHGFQFRF